MIIKSHHRTIRIKVEGKIYKYFLNLPELEFKIVSPGKRDKIDYLCQTFNEKRQSCYVPLFNVDVEGIICLGSCKNPINEEELANSFFRSYFTPDIKSSVYRIISKTKQNFYGYIDDYLEFFAEWEKTGNYKLIEK